MKFPSSTALLVISAAIASTANAFVPSSPTFTSRHVASTTATLQVQQPRHTSSCLGVSTPIEAVTLLKDLDDFDEYVSYV